MNRQEEIEVEVNFSFFDFSHEINLWTLIGGGSGVDVLKRTVDAHLNSTRRLKIPRILILGQDGKTTTAHAFINSLAIENVCFVSGGYLDSPGFSINSKFVFENGFEKAVVISNVESLSRSAESTLWQYMSTGKCCYGKIQKDEWLIQHYDGIIALTSNTKKEMVSKELLKQIDVIIELEPYQPHQIRQILEQRLKYMKIVYDEQSINLLINSCDNELEKLMQILKLCIIDMMGDDRNKLLKSDVEWALEHKWAIEGI